MATAIRSLEEKLAKHPGIRFTSGDGWIEIPAQSDDGFTIRLEASADSRTVYFEGWHEHFDTDEEALECAAFGLTDACRLAVTYRGDTATSWTVQSRGTNDWTARQDSCSRPSGAGSESRTCRTQSFARTAADKRSASPRRHAHGMIQSSSENFRTTRDRHPCFSRSASVANR